jgi:hypothetical protein
MADGTPVGAAPSPGWTPVPDPTKLTTDAVGAAEDRLRREMATLREIIEARILALENDAELRLDALREVRPQTERQINHLRELHNERFASVALQFAERDVRTQQAVAASKEALDAALLAAKELVGQQNTSNVEAAAKAEASFTKQIDQIAVTISTLERSFTDRLTELKERIDRGEGQGEGETAAQVEARAAVAAQLAAVNSQQGTTAGQRQLLALVISGLVLLLLIVTGGFSIYAATH